MISAVQRASPPDRAGGCRPHYLAQSNNAKLQGGASRSALQGWPNPDEAHLLAPATFVRFLLERYGRPEKRATISHDDRGLSTVATGPWRSASEPWVRDWAERLGTQFSILRLFSLEIVASNRCRGAATRLDRFAELECHLLRASAPEIAAYPENGIVFGVVFENGRQARVLGVSGSVDLEPWRRKSRTWLAGTSLVKFNFVVGPLSAHLKAAIARKLSAS